MPVHDFYCKRCKRTYEEFFHFNEERVSKCQKCGKKAKMLWSIPGQPNCGPRTLGTLAERNTNTLSDEAKDQALYKDRPKRENTYVPPPWRPNSKRPYTPAEIRKLGIDKGLNINSNPKRKK